MVTNRLLHGVLLHCMPRCFGISGCLQLPNGTASSVTIIFYKPLGTHLNVVVKSASALQAIKCEARAGRTDSHQQDRWATLEEHSRLGTEGRLYPASVNQISQGLRER
jgi:hypothetical protein